MGVKRGLRRESRLARGGDNGGSIARHALSRRLRGERAPFRAHGFFEDTDAFGIVYYANYLKFMERARSDMIRAVGVDQAAELAASGSAYAVVEVDIKYRRPARLGEDLQVVSNVQQVRACSVDIHQRVMRGVELLTDARV